MGEHGDLIPADAGGCDVPVAGQVASRPGPGTGPSCRAVQGAVRLQGQTESSDPLQRLSRERAIPRANVDRLQATPSYARRLLMLVKCLVSHTGRRPATPGR